MSRSGKWLRRAGIRRRLAPGIRRTGPRLTLPVAPLFTKSGAARKRRRPSFETSKAVRKLRSTSCYARSGGPGTARRCLALTRLRATWFHASRGRGHAE